MGQPRPHFCLFSFFSNTNFTETTVGFSGIRTRIIGVEGKHADHLATTTSSHVCKRVFLMCFFSQYLLYILPLVFIEHNWFPTIYYWFGISRHNCASLWGNCTLPITTSHFYFCFSTIFYQYYCIITSLGTSPLTSLYDLSPTCSLVQKNMQTWRPP